MLNVCSLSWDDLEAVGLRDHRLFARLDILFDNFNSATSYSGPAAIRLLRASCGQTSHAGLYQPAGEQCLLFDNLGRLGFAQQLAFNHNGRFDGFLDEVRGQGDLPEPLFAASSFGRALVAFDTSPIAADGEVLGRWWQQRQGNAAERLALFYNSITLHDGNRLAEANGDPLGRLPRARPAPARRPRRLPRPARTQRLAGGGGAGAGARRGARTATACRSPDRAQHPRG